VNFRAFVTVYNAVMGVMRARERLIVKGLFEKLQVDPDGLDYPLVTQLVKRCIDKLYLLAPGWQGEEDFALMKTLEGHQMVNLNEEPGAHVVRDLAGSFGAGKDVPMGQGEAGKQHTHVSFTIFERWWRQRMGLSEAETPVIPEFFTFALKNVLPVNQILEDDPSPTSPRKLLDDEDAGLGSVVAAGPARTAYSGLQAWSLLRPRLQLLLTAKRDWGTISDVYGQCGSFYGHEPTAWYIRNPESRHSQVSAL